MEFHAHTFPIILAITHHLTGCMMPSTTRKAQRCVFDCDGLLLETENIYLEMGKIILARYNKPFDWSLKTRLMGMPWPEAVDLLIKELDLPITKEDYYVQAAALDHMFKASNPLPGVGRLVRHLHEHKVPIAVASSSTKNSFHLKSFNHGDLFSKFQHIVLGDDPAVKKGKPNPDIFLEAARRLLNANSHEDLAQHHVETTLAFEDSLIGVQAARNAGMHVIWIPDPRMDHTAFDHDPYVHRLESMEHFNPLDWGLPPFTEMP